MLSVDLRILAILKAIHSQGHVVVCGSVAFVGNKSSFVNTEQKPRCHVILVHVMKYICMFCIHKQRQFYKFYRIIAGHLAAD